MAIDHDQEYYEVWFECSPDDQADMISQLCLNDTMSMPSVLEGVLNASKTKAGEELYDQFKGGDIDLNNLNIKTKA